MAKSMVKALIALAIIGAATWYFAKRRTVSGTITALYSDVKVSSPDILGMGDSADNALLGPSTYNY